MTFRRTSIVLAIGLAGAGCFDTTQFGLTVEEPGTRSNPPTLSWLAFSAPEGSGITDVSYEVIVMREEDGAVLLDRKGLTATSFTFEKPLTPGGRFRWSVRPWFTYQNERRVGPWAQRLPKNLQPGQTMVPVPMEYFTRISVSSPSGAVRSSPE